MQTFLEKLADYHLQNHLTEINDFCFVFPSRRAGLFFNKQLSQKTPKPLWAPKIVTINEFFAEINPTPVADSISLLFKLHLTYQRVMQSSITIDEFLPLGEMILSDFSDIDKYLANAKQVFANLSELKALEADLSYLTADQVEAIRTFWSSFNPHNLSEHQESFLSVWANLFTLYEEFRNELRGINQAYEGMIFREVAERADREKAINIPYKKVVFAGFNALNECEKVVFKKLYFQQKATFFWDYPEWILTDQKKEDNDFIKVQHEAARFLQDNLAILPSPSDWQQPVPQEMPEITIISASNDLVQAQVAHDELKNFYLTNTEAEKTALVLADEQQLMPVLHSIPHEYSAINITLGFPLKNTPAYSLVQSLLLMQKTTRKTSAGKTWFYHRNVLDVLRHQYMGVLTEGKNGSVIQKLISANQIFIESEQLNDSELLGAIFKKVDSAQELTQYLNKLLLIIYQQLEKKENTKIEREFVYHLYLVINRLSDILRELPQEPSSDTWQMLFKNIATQQSVPFKGEPLRGLQIMGILETRALDFDNLIVIGLNEGTFPKTSPPNSFIPFNLRKGHGLPTIDNQDSIFAYYFYRLINRAKKIKLVYTTTKSLTEEGEMSRFLQQLYYEYPQKITMQTMLQQVTIPAKPKIWASKDSEVMQIMNQWLSDGGKDLSPSALSQYLDCPLKFYYRYVAKISEPDEISEDLDPRVFGNLFHQIVEMLYKPFEGKVINHSDLDAISKNRQLIRQTMDDVFVQNIPFIKHKTNLFNDLQGKNSLVYEIIYNYILQFLECEKKTTPFKLIALEERVSCKLKLKNGLTVNIGGTIDRTDEKDGVIRIIDYKTGKATTEITNIEKLFTQDDHSENKAIFQTLLYSLVKAHSTKNKEIAPGVISVKKLYANDYDIQLYLKEGKEKTPITLSLVEENYREHLEHSLAQLFDSETPFTQTQNANSCDYCIYKANCLKD